MYVDYVWINDSKLKSYFYDRLGVDEFKPNRSFERRLYVWVALDADYIWVIYSKSNTYL